MSATELVQRLEYVRAIGVGRWSGRCPAHDDRDPSLSITEKDDGTILIHCHAGCGALEVLSAVGLEWGALYPPKRDHYQPTIRPKPDEAHERIVLAICEADRIDGKKLTREQLAREAQAWVRVHGSGRRSA